MIIYYLQKWIFKLLNKDNTGQISSVPMTKKLVGVLLFGVPLFLFVALISVLYTFIFLTATAKSIYFGAIHNILFDRLIPFVVLLGLLIELVNSHILRAIRSKTEANAKIYLDNALAMLNFVPVGCFCMWFIASLQYNINIDPSSELDAFDIYPSKIIYIYLGSLALYKLINNLRKAKKRNKKHNLEE